MPTPQYEELTLPIPTPRQPELLWPALEIFGAKDAKWSASSRRTHQPCAICVLVIHERGVAGAPPPAPGTMRRKGPGGGIVPADAVLCARHGQALKERDEKVAARYAGATAHANHMARRAS